MSPTLWLELRDRVARWWLCTWYGHEWSDRCDPLACIDCGRTARPRR